MKVVRLAVAGMLMGLAACATGVGQWDGGAKGEDASALRAEVRKSLVDSNWGIVGDTTELVAAKASAGGQRTIATFTFADEPGGSTFHLVGGSHHRFNWATFGILGLSMRNRAAIALMEWYDAWNAKHPKM